MRFVFDENISLRIAKAIAQLDSSVTVLSMEDYGFAGRTDEEWLAHAANDEQFVLISDDRNIMSRKAEQTALRR